MKIARFLIQDKVCFGILEGEVIREMTGDGLVDLQPSGRSYSVNGVRLLPPVVPSKVVGVSKNYSQILTLLGFKAPEEPLVFLKAPSSVIGYNDNIVYPEVSHEVTYEPELAVVIKSVCRNVTAKDAKQFILGYTCSNDVSARDIQEREMSLTRAKSFDTFCPTGPFIETEVDPSQLRIFGRLNGKEQIAASSGDLIFPVYELVSFVSRIMTLLPGDVISTGAAGVEKLHPGDTVEIDIEGVGLLRNYVVAE